MESANSLGFGLGIPKIKKRLILFKPLAGWVPVWYYAICKTLIAGPASPRKERQSCYKTFEARKPPSLLGG